MINILFQAFIWQFYDVPKKILRGWGNLLYFSFNYFSLLTLLATFFSPWRKYAEAYGGTFNIWENLETFIFNSMSRVIGAILRTGLIVVGIIFTIAVFISGLIVFLLWLLAPVLLIIILILGIKLLL